MPDENLIETVGLMMTGTPLDRDPASMEALPMAERAETHRRSPGPPDPA